MVGALLKNNIQYITLWSVNEAKRQVDTHKLIIGLVFIISCKRRSYCVC